MEEAHRVLRQAARLRAGGAALADAAPRLPPENPGRGLHSRRVYQAGTRDVAGRYMGGTENMQRVAVLFSLFAAPWVAACFLPLAHAGAWLWGQDGIFIAGSAATLVGGLVALLWCERYFSIAARSE